VRGADDPAGKTIVRTDPDILYLGMNAWDSPVQRPQHLARGLSRDHRVLYADPTAFSVVTRLRLGLAGTGSERGWRSRLRRLSDSLFVFTPPPLFPLSLWSPALNRLNARVAARLLSGAFRDLGFRPRIIWASSPQHLDIVDAVRAERVCYDCLDNVSAFYPGARRGTLLRRQEKALLGRAHAVFATDPGLAERCRGLCPNVHHVPNAVPDAFLRAPRTPCPPDLAGLPVPVVGYVGALAPWIDFDLVRRLAEARPRWSLVLIGPGRAGSGLGRLRNVHLLGERPHADLPAYLDRFHACVIPFRDSELTRAVNPVKLYEYLSRGRPVVATRTPALAPFSRVCTLCHGPQEFLAGLERAVFEAGAEGEARKQERIRFASENTWQQRTEAVRQVLEALGV